MGYNTFLPELHYACILGAAWSSIVAAKDRLLMVPMVPRDHPQFLNLQCVRPTFFESLAIGTFEVCFTAQIKLGRIVSNNFFLVINSTLK